MPTSMPARRRARPACWTEPVTPEDDKAGICRPCALSALVKESVTPGLTGRRRQPVPGQTGALRHESVTEEQLAHRRHLLAVIEDGNAYCQEGTPYSCSNFLRRRLPPRPTGLSMLPATTPKRTDSGSSARQPQPLPFHSRQQAHLPSPSGRISVSPRPMSAARGEAAARVAPDEAGPESGGSSACPS